MGIVMRRLIQFYSLALFSKMSSATLVDLTGPANGNAWNFYQAKTIMQSWPQLPYDEEYCLDNPCDFRCGPFDFQRGEVHASSTNTEPTPVRKRRNPQPEGSNPEGNPEPQSEPKPEVTPFDRYINGIASPDK